MAQLYLNSFSVLIYYVAKYSYRLIVDCRRVLPLPPYRCHRLTIDASSGGGKRSGVYFSQKVNQITTNPPVKAIRNILWKKKQKQTNGGVTHPPVAAVYALWCIRQRRWQISGVFLTESQSTYHKLHPTQQSRTLFRPSKHNLDKMGAALAILSSPHDL